MHRIALPNEGMLSSTAIELLVESGFRGRRNDRELVALDPENGVEFFYIRRV